MKKAILILVLLFLSGGLAGCERDNADIRAVEEYAIMLTRAFTFVHYEVLEIVYDEEHEHFIVYLIPKFPLFDGEEVTKIVLRIDENGEMRWVNYRDSLLPTP